jgi:outer membrane lipoprotein-sorting protein
VSLNVPAQPAASTVPTAAPGATPRVKATLTPDTALGEHQKKAEGETIQSVLQQIQSNVDRVQTLRADLAMSKAKDKDKKEKKKQKAADPAASASPQRSVKTGPMEISRGQGARLSVTRKDETDEYIANPQILWVYDHKAKEAQYIPTSLPFISGFVTAAMNMNVFAAMENDSIKNKGSQDVDGEPCWVLEGKSPDKLSMAGVQQYKMRFWISKRDGIPRRIGIPDQKDLVISLTNVQVNGKVDPSRFQFTPPEGVTQKNLFGF